MIEFLLILNFSRAIAVLNLKYWVEKEQIEPKFFSLLKILAFNTRLTYVKYL
ncbi:MAG: hypothetical protein ACKO2V_17305 [Snowella sp.]